MAASSLLEDAFALAQLGLTTSPLGALAASQAASQSQAWLQPQGAHLLAVPVLNGLEALRPVLAANASCAAGTEGISFCSFLSAYRPLMACPEPQSLYPES